jgi:hypothetical protein
LVQISETFTLQLYSENNKYHEHTVSMGGGEKKKNRENTPQYWNNEVQ